MQTHGTQTSSDRLIHDLAEAITTLGTWTYLALRTTSESEAVQQYLNNFRCTIALLIEITRMRHADASLCSPSEVARDHPARHSIQQDQIICLECGKALQLLSHRHLASHGLPPRTYKAKYHIAADEALCSRSVRRRRLQLARAQNPFKGSYHHDV